jgi:quercetin dioxygenase-like cupin family protein
LSIAADIVRSAADISRSSTGFSVNITPMYLGEDGTSRQEKMRADGMIDMVKSMKLIWLVVRLFALFISPLQAQERKDVTITQLLSTTTTSSGQPIVLPQKDAQILVSIYDMVPGATLPVHKHPYSRYGYVLSGNLRVTNLETGQVGTYKPGDFFPESVGQWHTGAIFGAEPLKLLVIDIVEKGQTNTTLQKR